MDGWSNATERYEYHIFRCNADETSELRYIASIKKFHYVQLGMARAAEPNN